MEEDILSVNIFDQNNSRSLTLNIRIPEFYNSKKSLRKGRCRPKNWMKKFHKQRIFSSPSSSLFSRKVPMTKKTRQVFCWLFTIHAVHVLWFKYEQLEYAV